MWRVSICLTTNWTRPNVDICVWRSRIPTRDTCFAKRVTAASSKAKACRNVFEADGTLVDVCVFRVVLVDRFRRSDHNVTFMVGVFGTLARANAFAKSSTRAHDAVLTRIMCMRMGCVIPPTRPRVEIPLLWV